MRKRKAVTQAIYREKKKVQSISEAPIPKTSKDIKENLDIKYQTTSTNGEFLRYSEYMEPLLEEKLMLVFMSDLGRDILGRSETMYFDGTFATAPEPFKQIFLLWDRCQGSVRLFVHFHSFPTKNSKHIRK